MHFIEPVSECSFSVNILADGITCHEYQPSGGDENQQCWVAVEADQVLLVQCKAEMVTRKYHVDLIVDGVLRNSWLSSRVEKPQKRTATIDFSTGISKNIRSLLECNLRTSSLRQQKIDFDNAKQPTIGTIEVQISKVDRNFIHRQTAPLPDERKKDRKDLPLTLGTAGVPPTHEIKFIDGERMSESDRKSVRNKMKMPRPGRSPWATFRYYYRLEASLNLPHGIDQNGTAASGIKASEAQPFQSLLSTAKPDDSVLFHSGSLVPEPSLARSLVPGSSSEEEPLSIVASRLLTQDDSVAGTPGESYIASLIVNDEELRPWSVIEKSTEKVNQVRSKIDLQVVGDLPQHTPQPTDTPLDQTCQEPPLPVPNQSLGNGPSLAPPFSSIHFAQMISQQGLPSPNSLHVQFVKHDQPSTPQTQECSDSSNNRDVAQSPAHSELSNMNIKRRTNEVEALRAQVKELHSKRDEAQRRSEEEQKKTEILASQLEVEWTELLITKADLERQIGASNSVIAAQLKEQEDLAASSK